jgi:hypothetical protein
MKGNESNFAFISLHSLAFDFRRPVVLVVSQPASRTLAAGHRQATSGGYSCGNASGWTGTAEATGPGPAPSRW